MRVVFMGTSEFAVPALEKLSASGHELKLVVTRPDRPRGRGRKLGSSPVKTWAEAHKIPLFQPEDVNASTAIRELVGCQPDLIAVASFGAILSAPILELPRFGCINIHPSLLPRYRGAAPVPHTIMNGDTLTGVTVFRLVKKMDAGPILGIRRMPIPETITAGELEGELAHLGADLLMEVIDHLERGAVLDIPQDDRQATYAPKLRREQGYVDWAESAAAIVNKIRAFNPEPLAYTVLKDEKGKEWRVHLLQARVNADAPPLTAGEVAVHAREILIVGTGEGAVRLERLQPESRKSMSAREFINGYRIHPGTRFE